MISSTKLANKLCLSEVGLSAKDVCGLVTESKGNFRLNNPWCGVILVLEVKALTDAPTQKRATDEQEPYKPSMFQVSRPIIRRILD
jgi:hypothetical protein